MSLVPNQVRKQRPRAVMGSWVAELSPTQGCCVLLEQVSVRAGDDWKRVQLI